MFEDAIILTMICPFCEEEHEVMVSEQSYLDYMSGTLAQIAFPYLPPTQREQIISHLCPVCQKIVFGEEE